MLTAAMLPEHDIFFRLDHIMYEPGSMAAAAVIAIDRAWWLGPDQMARAIETGSIWTANWTPPWPAASRAHAAADLDVLLAAIAPAPPTATIAPATAPILSDLVDGLRVAVSVSRDLECAERAEALRAIAKVESIVHAKRRPLVMTGQVPGG